MGERLRVAVAFNPATGGGDTAGRRRDTRAALAGAGLEVLWLETAPEDPGQGLPVVPDARPDDGLLDVAVLQSGTVLDHQVVTARVLARRRRRDPQLEVFQAGDHLVVEVVPAALTLCVPRSRGGTR